MDARDVSMVRDHIDKATDEELGARIRAMVEQGVVRFHVVPRPRWMTRDRFLPIGETEEREHYTGATRDEWRRKVVR